VASGFVPEFLILIGIDVFLGASILAVVQDEHLPTALPYVLEVGALAGFGELLIGQPYASSFPSELHFYYSFGYAVGSVLALLGMNLYLLFLKRRPLESAIVAVLGTVPSALGVLYFASALVNGVPFSLPMMPMISIEWIYTLFGVSALLIVGALVFFGRTHSETSLKGA
jgi:hypothetical protein